MREICTSGSVGGPVGQLAGPTRFVARPISAGLTRLSNGFSRKRSNLRAAMALFFAYYNFCKIHTSIRMTPANEGRHRPEALEPGRSCPGIG